MAGPGYGDKEQERSAPAPEAPERPGQAQPAISSTQTDAPVRIDDAFYEEVRLAVGRGTPSVLLGTSTKSLKRNMGRLTAAQRGERPHVTTSPLANHPGKFSRGDVADEATRNLAAATQVNLRYARTVRRRVIDESLRALAPVYGAKPAVIARWALSALSRKLRRDLVLTILFIAGAVLFPFLWSERSLHAWILVFAVTLLVAIVSVVAGEKFQIQRILVTHMRREVFNPATAPEPRNEKTRQRLAEVAARNEGNLVVFQGSSPFVGSGKLAHQWHLVIDLSRGMKPGSETRRKPIEFTSADLHAKIADALSRMGLPNVHVEERLFVNGRHIQDNLALLPSREHAPPANVSPSVLREAALYPTEDARVYVCAEIFGWQGQLVTTLFARAVRMSHSLFIESNFHVLPPPGKLSQDIDKLYDEPVAEQLWKALWQGLLYAVPVFLISPFAVAKHGWNWGRTKARRGVQSWKIRRGQVFDYGAARSIREDFSGSGTEDYFIERDQGMIIMLAQETLLRAVRNFLKQHNIDLGEFDSWLAIIRNSTHENLKPSNFSSPGTVVDERSATTDSGNVNVSSESTFKVKE